MLTADASPAGRDAGFSVKTAFREVETQWVRHKSTQFGQFGEFVQPWQFTSAFHQLHDRAMAWG